VRGGGERAHDWEWLKLLCKPDERRTGLDVDRQQVVAMVCISGVVKRWASM
jgi:hypothetical protein